MKRLILAAGLVCGLSAGSSLMSGCGEENGDNHKGGSGGSGGSVDAGDPDAADIGNPDTSDGAASTRVSITIDHNQVGAELKDFVMLVQVPGTQVPGGAATGQSDLWFSDTSNSPLAFEIERFEPAIGLIAWVKIPVVSNSVDTVIYLDTENVPANLPGSPWEGYAAAWHFGSEPSAGLVDSSAGQHNGSVEKGTLTRVEGRAGFAWHFDGAATMVQVPHHDDFYLTPNPTTLTVLIKIPTTVPPWGRVFDHEYDAPVGWYLTLDSTTPKHVALLGPGLFQGSYAHTTGISDDTWHHLAVTADGATGTIWLDGQMQESTPISAATEGPVTLRFGGSGLASDDYLLGDIDDVQLIHVQRSAEWLAAASANLLKDGFYTLRSE